MKHFSDIASNDDGPLIGEKRKIDEILDKELLLTNYRIKNSKFGKNSSGKYLTVQFQENLEGATNGNKNIVFTGSDVLITQLEKYGEELPFIARINKIDGKYYTLS